MEEVDLKTTEMLDLLHSFKLMPIDRSARYTVQNLKDCSEIEYKLVEQCFLTTWDSSLNPNGSLFGGNAAGRGGGGLFGGPPNPPRSNLFGPPHAVA